MQQIRIIGVPEEEEEKGCEKIFEVIIVELSLTSERKYLIKSRKCKEPHT